MSLKVKYCKECGRINSLEEDTCLSCGGEEFDELYFTPSWDSVEAYYEEDDSSLNPICCS